MEIYQTVFKHHGFNFHPRTGGRGCSIESPVDQFNLKEKTEECEQKPEGNLGNVWFGEDILLPCCS